jgi:hypothetical protein
VVPIRRRPASARVTMLWRSASVCHDRMLGIVRISQRFAGGIASATGSKPQLGGARPMGHSPHDRPAELYPHPWRIG